MSSYPRSDPRFYGGSKLPNNYMFRLTKNHEIKLRIHHGGLFMGHPSVDYIGGAIDDTNWGWDVDEMSYIEYRHPNYNLEKGLRPLNNDKHVLKFANDVKDANTVDLFVEHLVDTPVFQEVDVRNEDVGEKDGGVDDKDLRMK
ncbi:hypothetical protein SESBI_01906 [Sesbania bispinosa]|nr:hypothetical protein SESBI_01906 [Sesbania bispinosa]